MVFFDLFKQDKPQAVQSGVSPRSAIIEPPPAPGFQSMHNHSGTVVMVTGSSGFVGARVVEMCLERGADTVLAVDVRAPHEELLARFAAASGTVKVNGTGKVVMCNGTREGDLTSDEAMELAFTKVPRIDICIHTGGLNNPFYDQDEYMNVNYRGTLRIIEKCKQHKVPKLVFAGSTSTRFTGPDVTGQTEDELPMPTKWLTPYAESMALAEQAVTAANSNNAVDNDKNDDDDNSYTLTTITVAHNEVYGPHDDIFLGNILKLAGQDKLHIFGSGDTMTSVAFVDNYVHGLLCAADASDAVTDKSYGDSTKSAAAGNFYIVTDDETVQLWDFINALVVGLGFADLTTKAKLPSWLLYCAAYLANVVGLVTCQKMKLNPFSVKMLTMHRHFSIERAKKDLQYQPIVKHQEAVALTLDWYKTQWLPTFYKGNGKQSTAKKLD